MIALQVEGGRDEPAGGAVPEASVAERVARWMRPGVLRLPALPPLSLYVHLPWCLAKCPYCDFNSHAVRGRGADGRLPQAAYVDALIADLDASLPFVWGRRVHTVFIGGGTPSLFDPAEIGRLVGAIRARLLLEPGCEITMEANPGTFERERFRAFHGAGINRLSIGVQSFDDAQLVGLGRVHDAAQARAAIAEAKAVFDTWNLDLMYGLPGQTVEAAAADLGEALAHAPPHLSLYHLTIEPNTLFAARPPDRLPDDDSSALMLDQAVALTAAAGLGRYEVSAYARSGHHARHNVNYWQFGDYLGIGAGAHGKLSFPHRIVRQVRLRDPQHYLDATLGGDAGKAVASEREVPRADLAFEFMLNALRLADGVPLASFGERTGLPPSAIAAGFAEGRARGLLADDATRLRTTPRGFDFLNDAIGLFLP